MDLEQAVSATGDFASGPGPCAASDSSPLTPPTPSAPTRPRPRQSPRPSPLSARGSGGEPGRVPVALAGWGGRAGAGTCACVSVGGSQVAPPTGIPRHFFARLHWRSRAAATSATGPRAGAARRASRTAPGSPQRPPRLVSHAPKARPSAFRDDRPAPLIQVRLGTTRRRRRPPPRGSAVNG